MYAILETGSKQYKVEEGDVLEVERLDQDKISEENKIYLDHVLLIKDKDVHIGQPFVKDARVTASVLEESKAPKIIVFKKKSKKGYKRTHGHRQKLHRIQVEKIEMNVKPTADTKPKAEAKPKVEEKPKVETKPKAEAKPKVEEKPKAEAKPKTETKKKTEEKPKTKPKAKAETKPKTEKKTKAASEKKKSTAKSKTAKEKEKE